MTTQKTTIRHDDVEGLHAAWELETAALAAILEADERGGVPDDEYERLTWVWTNSALEVELPSGVTVEVAHVFAEELEPFVRAGEQPHGVYSRMDALRAADVFALARVLEVLGISSDAAR